MGLLVAPKSHKLILYQGVPFAWDWLWSRGETRFDVAPVDLTGCTGVAEVWDASGASIARMSTDPDDGLTLGGAAGTIHLEISLVKAQALPALAKPGHWNLKIIWPDGDITRRLEGPVVVDPDKTNG